MTTAGLGAMGGPIKDRPAGHHGIWAEGMARRFLIIKENDLVPKDIRPLFSAYGRGAVGACA
jgi:hypothetical protein